MKEVHGGNIYKYDHKVYDFSANLNPLGMPPAVKQAIIDNIDSYESYPDPFNRELTSAISRFHSVRKAQICCGNGAADIIFRIALALKPKKGLLISPTFSEYEEALRTAGCAVEHYFLKKEDDFTADLRMIEAVQKDHDVVFLCNPNNPTGIPVEKELVLKLAEGCRQQGAILVIDECFADFMEEEERYSVLSEIEHLPQVIILKAFTKIYAMAGLRLGYCICGDEEIGEKIRGTLQPWAVSTAASKAGCAAMGLSGFVEKTKQYIKENREFLVKGLQEQGYEVYNTKVNYIFFRSEIALQKPLQAFDILIRSCSNYPSLDEHYYRIAVRTREENQYFLERLAQVTDEAGKTADIVERKEDKTNG